MYKVGKLKWIWTKRLKALRFTWFGPGVWVYIVQWYSGYPTCMSFYAWSQATEIGGGKAVFMLSSPSFSLSIKNAEDKTLSKCVLIYLYRTSKRKTKLDVATHVCNLNTQEGKVGGLLGIQGQSGPNRQANLGKINKTFKKVNKRLKEIETQVKMK